VALQLARTVRWISTTAHEHSRHTSLLLTRPRQIIRARLAAGGGKIRRRAGEIASDLARSAARKKEPRAQIAGNLNSIAQRGVEILRNTRPEKSNGTPVRRSLYTSKFDEPKMQQALVKVWRTRLKPSVPTPGSR